MNVAIEIVGLVPAVLGCALLLGLAVVVAAALLARLDVTQVIHSTYYLQPRDGCEVCAPVTPPAEGSEYPTADFGGIAPGDPPPVAYVNDAPTKPKRKGRPKRKN